MSYANLSSLLAAGLCLLLATACTSDSSDSVTVNPQDVTVWSGPTLTFEKANEADPTLPANQDRITPAVWLTRGNDGGQIYNASTESSADKEASPDGTRWAEGTTADLAELSFTRFRAAVGDPKQVVGKDLVLLLVEENVVIDVRFTRWATGKLGGFAYERGTE